MGCVGCVRSDLLKSASCTLHFASSFASNVFGCARIRLQVSWYHSVSWMQKNVSRSRHADPVLGGAARPSEREGSPPGAIALGEAGLPLVIALALSLGDGEV